MDLRTKKTLRAIRQAFLELRASKPLERITIKELTEKAEISKATFYLHYRDIYDLSEQIQQELIREILNSMDGSEAGLYEPDVFMRSLFQAFIARRNMILILFSQNTSTMLPASIDRVMKENFFERNPSLRTDVRFHVSMTYQIYGAYYAFLEHNKHFSNEAILNTIMELQEPSISLFRSENQTIKNHV